MLVFVRFYQNEGAGPKLFMVKSLVYQVKGACIMPRRGENIHKRKDGRWEGRYIDFHRSDGKAHYKSVYAMSYTEVREKMNKLKAVPRVQRPLTSLVTMEQLSLLWLENKKVQIKESSYASYYQVIHGHIVPYFKNIKASAMTCDLVNQFIRDKLAHGRIADGGELSAKRVNDILNVLLQIIQYGEKKQQILGFDYEIARPKSEYAELEILTHSEQERLIHHVKSNLDHKKLGVLFALYTGIRLGEACALRWSNIDW